MLPDWRRPPDSHPAVAAIAASLRPARRMSAASPAGSRAGGGPAAGPAEGLRGSGTAIVMRCMITVIVMYPNQPGWRPGCRTPAPDVNLKKHPVRVRLGKGSTTTTRGFHTR